MDRFRLSIWKYGNSGKSQGENLLMKKPGKFMKNCSSLGKVRKKWNCFAKCPRKFGHCAFYLHVLSKDNSYHCYVLLYR